MLFGDRFVDLAMRRQTVRMDHRADPLPFREYWKRNYGPTIAAYGFNADRPERIAAPDHVFLGFLAGYLLVTATKPCSKYT